MDDPDPAQSGLLEKIIRICDRFKRDRKALESCKIERLLPVEPCPDELLEELLYAELGLRREDSGASTVRDGEVPGPRYPTTLEYRGQESEGGAPSPWDNLEGTAEIQGQPSLGPTTPGPLTDAPTGIDRTGDDLTEGRDLPGETVPQDPTGLTLAAPSDPPSRSTTGTAHGYGEAAWRSGSRFNLLRIHARGGVGEVWLARDKDLGREVALKRLQPGKAGDPSQRARFLREAWITAQLQHPGIVPVFELSRATGHGQPYYAMRFIKGPTLLDSIREYHARRAQQSATPGELRQLLWVFASVCQVVAYAHSRGVIHRDLKGQNIALGDFGEVMVLDWGMAKIAGEPEPIRDHPGGIPEPGDSFSEPCTPPSLEATWAGTGQGSVLGTPSYMAPEQAQGFLDLVSERTDVYGLGAILYELLVGEPPFVGPTAEVLGRVVRDDPIPPRRRIADLPPALEAVCLKCLSKDAAHRYPSAGEVAKEVQRFLADEPIDAFPEPKSARARRWVNRHRTLAAVVVATLVVATACLSIATTLLMLSNDREKASRSRAEEHLSLVRKAVDRFFSNLGNDRQLKARGLEKLQRGLLSEARDFYLRLPLYEGASSKVLAEKGWIELNLARITNELGDFAEAIKLARIAKENFEELTRIEPTVVEHRVGLARALDSLGRHHWSNHQPEEAKRHLEAAATAWETLVDDHSSVHQYRHDYVTSLNRLGRLLCVVLGDFEAASRVLSKSDGFCGQLVLDDPSSVEARNSQAEAVLLMGYALAGSDFEAARPLLDQALADREKLLSEEVGSFERQSELLDTCVLIATCYSNARVAGSIPSLYGKVREIGERLADEHRDVPIFAENRCLIETLFSIHLAQSGEHRRATAGVDEALVRSPRSGLALLYAACCYSVASEAAGRDSALPGADLAELVRRYQDRAVKLLYQTSETGLFQQPHQFEGLKSKDPDLAPLRHRADFRRLIEELERAAEGR